MKSQHFKKNDIDSVTLIDFILPPLFVYLRINLILNILFRLNYFRLRFLTKAVDDVIKTFVILGPYPQKIYLSVSSGHLYNWCVIIKQHSFPVCHHQQQQTKC